MQMAFKNKYTSADLMRKQNAKSILHVIYKEDGIYRRKVASRINLAAQTVTNIITVLISENLVVESPMQVAGRGRNPFALQINYNFFYIISIKMADHHFEIYINDLSSKVLYQEFTEYQYGISKIEQVKSIIAKLYDDYNGLYNININAIVISLPGIVDGKTGVVIKANALEWENINLKQELSDFPAPIFVLNDVDLLAHYENSISINDGNLMIVKVEDGVGSALVIDKRVVSSPNHVTGEFGHVTAFKTDEYVKCFCGRSNCITQFISKNSLSRRLGKSYPEIVVDVSENKSDSVKIIEEIPELIAAKIIDLIVLLDLERVILVGQVVEDFQPMILPKMRELINQNMSSWVPFNKLEFKKYECYPEICSRYIMDYYFSDQNELEFLWDTYL